MENFQITLDENVVEAINRHAVETFPFECCGFLFGDEPAGRFISHAAPVTNSKEGDQRRRFEISPLDYLRAEGFALKNNTQLLGIYHSHPNHPAIASQHDLAVAMPFFSYVIVSVTEGKAGDIKSWKLKEDTREFQEEEIKVLQHVETPA